MKPNITPKYNNTFSDDRVARFIESVGERVKFTRQKRSISRRELSEKSGVSQRYLAQLETGNGNISIGLLFQIAVALDYPPSRFLEEESQLDAELQNLLKYYGSADINQRRRALQELQPSFTSVNKGKRVCLIGLRGAGKSTLGKLLADELEIEFMELNTSIEEQSGMPVSEVIALYGQEGYRQLENQALNKIFETKDSIVLAVGGGIVAEQETYDHLLRTFHTIWLKASPEEHMERVREQGDNRPMAGNPKAMEELRSILTSRESQYARADSMIDTSEKKLNESKDDLVNVVSKLIRK